MKFFTDIMPSFIGEATVSPIVGVPGVGGYGGWKLGKTDTGKDIFDPGYYFHESPQERENKSIINDALDKANISFDEMENIIKQHYGNQTKLSTPEGVKQYKQLLYGFDPNQYVADTEDFAFKKSVEDYVNPAKDRILKDVGLGVQGTAAGAGLGLSRGTLNKAIGAQTEKSEQLWKDAQDAYNQERATSLNEWKANLDKNQSRLDKLLEGTKYKIDLLGGALSHDEQQQSDYMKDLLAIMGDKTQTNLNTNLAGLKTESRSPVDLAGSILKFI